MKSCRFYLLSILFLFVLFISGCAHKNLMEQRLGAYQLYNDGDYAAAAQEFEKLIEQMPKDAELWFRLGNSYAKIKNPTKAVIAYENALLRDPELVKAWYNKGVIHLQEALKTFVDMDNYVSEDDPVAKRGARMREEIFEILGGPKEVNQHEE